MSDLIPLEGLALNSACFTELVAIVIVHVVQLCVLICVCMYHC